MSERQGISYVEALDRFQREEMARLGLDADAKCPTCGHPRDIPFEVLEATKVYARTPEISDAMLDVTVVENHLRLSKMSLFPERPDEDYEAAKARVATRKATGGVCRFYEDDEDVVST